MYGIPYMENGFFFVFLLCFIHAERLRKGGDPINSFMAWVGGKKALRDEILARFPLEYKRYIEVFGGAGWVLFHKPPDRDFEVFNDFNGNLVNLYRCVREQPDALMGELRYMLNSRLDFEYMKHILHSSAVLPDVRRAAYYYALIRYSYAAGTSTYGSQPHAMWNNFPLIEAAAGRLQKVIIENKDCVKLIGQYDRPESFFYCDPPYYQADQYYEAVSPDGFDHKGLAEALFGIKGKFLLSYNDCPYIRELPLTISSTTRGIWVTACSKRATPPKACPLPKRETEAKRHSIMWRTAIPLYYGKTTCNGKATYSFRGSAYKGIFTVWI